MAVAIPHRDRVAEFEEVLTNRLWQFRLALEGQAGQSAASIESPVTLLLSDLCRFAGLSEEQHARVLGQEGVAHVNWVLEMRVTTATSGCRRAARQQREGDH